MNANSIISNGSSDCAAAAISSSSDCAAAAISSSVARRGSIFAALSHAAKLPRSPTTACLEDNVSSASTSSSSATVRSSSSATTLEAKR